MPDAVAEPHINRVPFSGVLTRLNEPSTRPPNGARGHRVCIATAVAEHALPTLIGMGVDVDTGFKDHDKRVKVGVITNAYVKDDDLIVEGHLFGKDFANEVDYIKKNKAQLGMSYEIADCDVENEASTIWNLQRFTFTGGAILRKSAAAYQQTSIAASLQYIATSEEFFAVPEICQELSAYLTLLQCAAMAYHAGRIYAHR